MSNDLLGSDILGDMGTGGAPSLPVDGPEFGPAAGGKHYTDAPTILAVQKRLNALGFPCKVDGKFGPETEGALFKFSGQHGPPDDDILDRLGVKVGGEMTPAARAQTLMSPTAGPKVANVELPQASFWSQPAWKGAPIKRWQGALAGAGLGLIVAGMVGLVRR